MAVVASHIEDSAALLRHARHKLISGIVKHFKRESLRKIIEEVQSLGDKVKKHGGKAALNSPWSKSAGDACDEARSPIVLAAINHNLDAMQLLLNTGLIDLNAESSRGVSVLFRVCRTGNEEAVAMLLRRKGVSIDIESAVDHQPLHEAFFSSLSFDYSVVFHSDWGSPALKRSLIDWWKGGSEFTPSEEPLKARWPGAIPLVALLLEKGADPTVKVSYCGISPLTAVQNPSCLLKSAESLALAHLPGTVDFHSSRKSDPSKEADDILTFRVVLRDRSTKRKLEVMVDVDYNMELPKDVDAGISSEIREILASKKTRTMRGLIEAYTPKDKSELRSEGLSEIKLRMEKVESRVEAHAALAVHSAKDVKQMREDFSILHQQHVVIYEKHLDEEAYRARIKAIEAGRKTGSAQYKFFDTVAKELIRIFDTCKLHMRNPDKLDKGALAAKGVEAAANLIAQQLADGIGTLSDFIPPPFSVVGKVAGFLVKAYSDHQQNEENHRVVDLLPIDHKEMCIDLALELAEKYAEALKGMEPENAEKWAKNAVGIMFALMCDPNPKKTIKTIGPRHSFDEIEGALFKAVSTSEFFQQKLKEYSTPAKSRSWMPSFLRSKDRDKKEKQEALLVLPPAEIGPSKLKSQQQKLASAGDMMLPDYRSRSKSPSPVSVVSSTPEKDQDKRQTPSPILKPRPGGETLVMVS